MAVVADVTPSLTELTSTSTRLPVLATAGEAELLARVVVVSGATESKLTGTDGDELVDTAVEGNEETGELDVELTLDNEEVGDKVPPTAVAALVLVVVMAVLLVFALVDGRGVIGADVGDKLEPTAVEADDDSTVVVADDAIGVASVAVCCC
jgi:hypothetical protein